MQNSPATKILTLAVLYTVPLEDILFIETFPSFSSLKVSIVYVLEAVSISIEPLAGSNNQRHVVKLQSNRMSFVSTRISRVSANG